MSTAPLSEARGKREVFHQGHTFGENMRCVRDGCGRSWYAHQLHQTSCDGGRAPGKPFVTLVCERLIHDLELWRKVNDPSRTVSIQSLGKAMRMTKGQTNRSYERAAYYVKVGGDPDLMEV